ncbi:MAG: prephenate dehydrogenase/arogenate dehydrogenase family protein [Planctomycetota bacterium]
MPETSKNAELAALRARLDALDHDLLRVLARRMGVVSDIAEVKRNHAVKIRDLGRERAVLADRARAAERLGLPAPIVASIMRLIMLASRDHQASMRAEVPPDEEPVTVAIIGGQGGMGRLLQRLFGDLGHAVIVADVGTELSNVEAASAADVVCVCVPIEATEAVIAEVGPHVGPEALLMDVTSLKSAPVRAMLDATKASGASVVGTHPMFGPDIHTFQGQRLALCPGRGERWLNWVEHTFSARGLSITRTTAEEHDRVMALVQVLYHYRTQVMGLTMARFGRPLSEVLGFTSPAYLLESYVTARHFAQDPDLYGPIEMRNPETAAVTAIFRETAAELADVLAAGDQERFRAAFEEVRTYFGAFTDEALERSGHLIDRLVELTAGAEDA